MGIETTRKRLIDLLDYLNDAARLSSTIIDDIKTASQFFFFEHQFHGRPGIAFNTQFKDGNAFLRLKRLVKETPPSLPTMLRSWVDLTDDPKITPRLLKKIVVTVPEHELLDLFEGKKVEEEDVQESPKQDKSYKKFDVILRIESWPKIEEKFHDYLKKSWAGWAEEEKIKRESIKLYHAFFSMFQKLRLGSDSSGQELVWGHGFSQVKVPGTNSLIRVALLEIPIELELDESDNSIYVIPKLGKTTKLNNEAFVKHQFHGASVVSEFYRGLKHKNGGVYEVDPFDPITYEELLRQNAAHISEGGVYLPDDDVSKDKRELPNATSSLVVSDIWGIYLREGRFHSLVEDTEALKGTLLETPDYCPNGAIGSVVSEPSKDKPGLGSFSTGSGGGSRGGGLTGMVGSGSSSGASPSEVKSETPKEYLFPKPFNQEQVNIAKALESQKGVVVQGPPGTGKTHTIANIICDHLARGKRVLVSAQNAQALLALEKHIPKDIRKLVISMAQSDAAGLKKLESAVKLLSEVVVTANPKELMKRSKELADQANQLSRKIEEVKNEIKSWGLKQLERIPSHLNENGEDKTPGELAMELASILDSLEKAKALIPDEIGGDIRFSPSFADSDLVSLRESRRAVGADLDHLGLSIPEISNLPNENEFLRVHQDLSNSCKIDQELKSGESVELSLSVDNAVEKADSLKEYFKSIHTKMEEALSYEWTQKFLSWIEDGKGEEEYFVELFDALCALNEKRLQFIKKPVLADDPADIKEGVYEAIKNLIAGKKPFGLISIGKTAEKAFLSSIKINNSPPSNSEDWQHLLDFLDYQQECLDVKVRWNSAATLFPIPLLSFEFSRDGQLSGSEIAKVTEVMATIIKLVEEEIPETKRLVKQLFPYGIDENLIWERSAEAEAERTRLVDSIEKNVGKYRLSIFEESKKRWVEYLETFKCPVIEAGLDLFRVKLGDPAIPVNDIRQAFSVFQSRLKQLLEFKSHFSNIIEITGKIEASGASNWAQKLRTIPFGGSDDNDLTPSDWYELWQLRRKEGYLCEIDGREKVKKLNTSRYQLEEDQKRTFENLTTTRTYLGLYENMTDHVKSALLKFMNGIKRLGKGTGVRAPRHRQDIRQALLACTSGVPCWVMPISKVSESLPAEFDSFDLVIIDEASQADFTALPVIMRAKKVLIVGDDKQVTPTNMISEENILRLQHNHLQDQPFGGRLLPGESIYDLALETYPGTRIMLKEHFRCVEPIIRFSMPLYEDLLVPLRIPKASERLDPPLVDIYCHDGYREDDVNVVEAECISDEILRLSNDLDFQGRSIGVISLIGEKQATLIQEALFERLGQEVFMRHEIECGNSSRFQGNEKDVIFLSMIEHQYKTAFTSDVYVKRFNVAMSRARDRVYLVRSLNEEEITNHECQRYKLIQHFKDPMPLSSKREVEDPIELCQSGFERDFYKRMTDLGYSLIPQVRAAGYYIDFVIEGDNDRRLAIELDGDQFHGPDRWLDDMSRQAVLERLGWKIWRCWASTYFLNPSTCIAELEGLLADMGIFPGELERVSSIFSEFRIYPQEPKNVDSFGDEEDEVASEGQEGTPVSEEDQRPTDAGQLSLDGF